MYRGLRLRAGIEQTLGILQESIDELARSASGRELLERGASREQLVTIFSDVQYPAIEAQVGVSSHSSRAMHLPDSGDILLNGGYMLDAKVGASILGHELRHRINRVERLAGTLSREADELDAQQWEQRVLAEL